MPVLSRETCSFFWAHLVLWVRLCLTELLLHFWFIWHIPGSTDHAAKEAMTNPKTLEQKCVIHSLIGGGVKHHQVQRMHVRWLEEMYQTKGTEGKVLSMMPLLVWNCVLADQRWGWWAEEWCYRSTGCLHSYIPLSSLELYWLICLPFPVKPIAALRCP